MVHVGARSTWYPVRPPCGRRRPTRGAENERQKRSCWRRAPSRQAPVDQARPLQTAHHRSAGDRRIGPKVPQPTVSCLTPFSFSFLLPATHTEFSSDLEPAARPSFVSQDEGLLGSLALQSRSSSMRRRGYIPWRQRARVQRKKLRPMGSSRCACPPLEPPRALGSPNPGGKRLPKRGVGLRC